MYYGGGDSYMLFGRGGSVKIILFGEVAGLRPICIMGGVRVIF
jgi:hypothetical protein